MSINLRAKTSYNLKRYIKKSKKKGGKPPLNPINQLLRNVKTCVVHNINNTILIVNYGLNRIEILNINGEYVGSFGENNDNYEDE